MAAQLGRLMLLKRSDGAGGFTTICALRSNSLKINNAEIDVTRPDCVNPGGPLNKATLDGIKTVSLSAAGLFEDEQNNADMATLAMSATPRDVFTITVPAWGTLQAEFMLSDYSLDGDYDGTIASSFDLSASGQVDFTAE